MEMKQQWKVNGKYSRLFKVMTALISQCLSRECHFWSLLECIQLFRRIYEIKLKRLN